MQINPFKEIETSYSPSFGNCGNSLADAVELGNESTRSCWVDLHLYLAHYGFPFTKMKLIAQRLYEVCGNAL